MMRRSIRIISAILVLTMTSCMGSKLELTYNNQEGKIDSYLKTKMLVKNSSSRTDTLGFKLDTTALDNGTIQIDTSWITEKIDSSWTDTLNVVCNGGANRLIVKEGEGEALDRNGFVSFYYAGYTFSGSFSASNLFITNHKETAEQSNWDLTDSDMMIYEINIGEAKLIQGLKDGLLGVRSGEECEIVFSGKYGFGDEDFGIIPANSAQLWKIWVVGVTND